MKMMIKFMDWLALKLRGLAVGIRLKAQARQDKIDAVEYNNGWLYACDEIDAGNTSKVRDNIEGARMRGDYTQFDAGAEDCVTRFGEG